MKNKSKVWLNNKIIPWEEANVHILSHGLSRGSAVFEAFGTHVGPDGVFTFRMDAHLARLEQTVKLLGMQLKYSLDEIANAVSKIASINTPGRGIVKLMAYWGEETVIDLVLESKLDVAIFTIPASEKLVLDKINPISACISKWRKLHPETIPVQAKACANYLNGYLIRKDANDRGFDIGLTVGTDGYLAEGSIESVFIVKDDVLKTPPLGRILSGITRDSIVNIANDNDIKIEETILQQEDLYTADEIFTTHTGIKVTPIKRLEEKNLKAPGPVTTRIMELMDNVISFKDKRYAGWFQQLY
ncbi:MAG: hypothetical protein GY857_08855 [Desulfobacula sp.]|nr:hypothetical protein [Desulfobacula sp.]